MICHSILCRSNDYLVYGVHNIFVYDYKRLHYKVMLRLWFYLIHLRMYQVLLLHLIIISRIYISFVVL